MSGRTTISLVFGAILLLLNACAPAATDERVTVPPATGESAGPTVVVYRSPT